MSIAGFKKQVNKANQFVSEIIAGAKGTELDDDFVEMEKKTDSFEKLLHELAGKVNELLQPNPASRVKMAASKGISKIKGQSSNMTYPQPEGNLADVLLKFGPEFGNMSLYGSALIETGECFKEMADEKYKLEDTVKQNFLEPLQHLENKDLKEVNHHRKKLVGRRLDYDCKKRKHSKEGSSVTEDELGVAKEKFDESKQLAEIAMCNLLESDAEQISQLSAFVDAKFDFHKRCVSLLEQLHSSLQQKSKLASTAPKREVRMFSSSSSGNKSSHGGSFDASDFITPRNPQLGNISNETTDVKAEALYDFEAENHNELEFRAGAVIRNITRIDENWLEGSYGGRTGYFPTSYVKVISGYL